MAFELLKKTSWGGARVDPRPIIYVSASTDVATLNAAARDLLVKGLADQDHRIDLYVDKEERKFALHLTHQGARKLFNCGSGGTLGISVRSLLKELPEIKGKRLLCSMEDDPKGRVLICGPESMGKEWAVTPQVESK